MRIFQLVTLFKKRLQRRCFLVIFENIFIRKKFSSCFFIKNKTLTELFSCEFCEFSQLVILLKARLQRRCFFVKFQKFFNLQLYWKWDSSTSVFLRVLRNFSTCHIIKNETPAQVFSCEFCKVFKNTYFAEHGMGYF